MPRYFFHYHDDHHRTPDAEGVILPDAEAAWYQAVRSARDMIAGGREAGCGRSGSCVEIADEEGLPIDAVRLEEIPLAAC